MKARNPWPCIGPCPCRLLPASWYALAVWVQVLLAVLARGYFFDPVDPNEPFSNYPVGGEPINGLLMDFKKSGPHPVSTQ